MSLKQQFDKNYSQIRPSWVNLNYSARLRAGTVSYQLLFVIDCEL